jgi:hypothetical protein
MPERDCLHNGYFADSVHREIATLDYRRRADSTARHPMKWLRTIYQKLSYQLGFARGLRGRPFALSWWADMTTYATGHIDGRFKSIDLDF